MLESVQGLKRGLAEQLREALTSKVSWDPMTGVNNLTLHALRNILADFGFS